MMYRTGERPDVYHRPFTGENALAGPVIRNRHRVAEIGAVVSRHGFSWLVEEFGHDPAEMLRRIGIGRSKEAQTVSQPQHLRMALEELGTTYIKLGQMLSTREDLLPPDYVAELAVLREHVHPVPSQQIVEEIEDELGRSLSDLFLDFEYDPVASASIGQVHAARLFDGTRVVIKVQKPGVAGQVEQDLLLIRRLAQWAQRHGQIAKDYDIVGIADEFAWTLRNELDYLREGRNTDRFRENFRSNPEVRIPRVYWSLTSPRVITYERLDGIKIDDLEGLERNGTDRKALAVRAARIILDEVFEHGFFHADPHQGNFAVDPQDRIIIYDFGMVGTITSTTRRHLLRLMSAIIERDIERVLDELASLEVTAPGTDRSVLGREVGRLIDRYYGLALNEYQFSEVFHDIMAVIRHHRLRVPGNLSLLMKTLAVHEGTARTLDPEFSAIDVATPYVRRASMERYLPSDVLPRLLKSSEDVFDLVLDGPQRVSRLLRRFEQGDFEAPMRIIGIERIMADLRILVNRLVVAWLIGTGLISLSILLAVYQPGWIESWRGIVFTFTGIVIVSIVLLIGLRIRR